MSAIVSLLRVMMLRDAEAITLEAGKVPTLRRRGAVEALAMPALEAKLIEDFAMPLLAGREGVESGPQMVTFVDEDGAVYPVTIEGVVGGFRVVVRRGRAVKTAAAGTGTGTGTAAATGSGTAAATGSASASASVSASASASASASGSGSVRREELARVIGEAVAMAHERKASDLFVSSGGQVRVRIDGRLEVLDVAIDDDELAACVRGLGGEATGVNVDLALELRGVRIRVNAFDHSGGHAVAARLVRDDVPGFAELGLPAELGSIVELRDGLVLVCGSTGSGKSTTLASLIDLLDQRRAAHVITLEDPIEYRFKPRRCLIHQRELGTHIPTFAAGLRAALREAPDVILLGELRDRETLAAALTAAESGHLVLATLHAPNAAGAIDRVIDAFHESERHVRSQLAGALRTIVTQYLLPRRDGGRAVAIEYVPVTAAIANIIRKGDLHTLPTAIQSGRDAGMIPLERSLAKLLDAGTVAAPVVKRIAADHDLLAALASKLR